MKFKYYVILISSLGLVLLSFTLRTKADKPIKAPKGYVFIPMGEVVEEGKKQTVQAFYISETEVTNREYRKFLNDMKEKFLWTFQHVRKCGGDDSGQLCCGRKLASGSK
ncbi:MAG: formylglycine-generating enzyme family protein [Bacteroidetes bacterium]|nr:formylglycine-generating enzyme family protein [Bacteroidota bacterium]